MRLSTFGLALGAALTLCSAAQADPMTTPAMAGPLTANANPMSVDSDFGKIYVTGAVTGLAFTQSNPAHLFSGDGASEVDLSNAQVFIQKTDGLVQFFVQAGAYSFPDLGGSYIKASKATPDFFGLVPQAFVKIVPTDNFSIEVGKLPTLIGAEYTFSFENMNIERGLLWNQENAVNNGIQLNYSSGPFSLSVSWNDGFYSKRYNWLTALASYAVTSTDTIAVDAGGNFGRSTTASLVTPYFQNNSQIYNLMWTHTDGPWVFSPYLQYTNVSSDAKLGIPHAATTFGAAVLTSYAFNSNFSVAGRVEYISSTGKLSSGAPSLLYGPGSKAWSFTITPTYQYKIYYVRADASYVTINSGTPGFELGSSFNKTSQGRLMLEAGILF